MKYSRYRLVLIGLAIIFLIDFFDNYLLLWAGLPEDGMWKWILDKGTSLISILLIIIALLTQSNLLKRVKESEGRYRLLTEISPQPILVHQDGIIVYANPSVVKVLGAQTLNDVIGRSVFDYVHSDFKEEAYKQFEKLMAGERLDFTEFKISGLDGKVKDVELIATFIQFNGKPSIMLVGRDITERKKLERELKESEEQYRQVVELSPNGIAIHKFGLITYVNPAGVKQLGAQTMGNLIGKNILEFIQPEYWDVVRKRWKIMKKDHKPAEFIEEKMVRLDHQIIDVEMMGLPITINDEQFVQVFFRNITDRKKAQKLMYQMAYQDPLTGLPNRMLFEEKLNEALNVVQENNKKTLAVMFLDLDGFKEVNDRLGHEAGDLLLKEVSQRLKSCMRENDLLSRLAGDEFTILLQGAEKERAIKVANRILKFLASPYSINGKEVRVTSSIGISVYQKGFGSAGNLIKNADTAMYKAKQKGKNDYYVYEENYFL